MAISNLLATSFQTPDATLGGNAVTSATVTGHASTVTSAVDGSSDAKSCRWFGFAAVAPFLRRVLKITHLSDGTLVNDGANTFTLSYSLNGGSNWTNAVSRSNFTGSQGPTVFELTLDAGQDTSQVQVRVLYDAFTPDVGHSASVTATISAINIEILAGDTAGGMM